MGKIAILTAMDKERVQIEKLLKELGAGDRFILCKCGIGKVSAAITATELIVRDDVGAIINTGCAGGNSCYVKVGDVVIADRTAYHDVFCGDEAAEWDFLGLPQFMQPDPGLLRQARQCMGGKGSENVKFGLICTGDQFVTSVGEMDKIRAKYPDVHAVDMETAAIAHVCCKFNVPFLSLRVVSDTPGVDAHTEQYQDFWDKLADRSFETMKQILISLINQK